MEVALHQKNTINKMNLEEMLVLNQYLVESIKRERNVQARRMKSKIGYGDKVSWINSKSGEVICGEVVKVMRKYAKVNVPGGPYGQQWRVPLSMLETEE